jgi:Arylsulfotransferase (ASST)
MTYDRTIRTVILHPVTQIILLFVAVLVCFQAFRFQTQNDTTPIRQSTPSEPSNLKTSPTLTKYSKQAYPGFTLAPTTETEEIVLLNMKGEIVHSWPFDAVRARLLPNCNILVIHGTKWGKERKPWKDLRNSLREYDWSGTLVWEYTASEHIHHDASRLDEERTLLVKRMTIAAPLSSQSRSTLSHLQRPRVRSDAVVEIARDGAVLWEWRAHEHLEPLSCGWRGCQSRQEQNQYRPAAGITDWTHMNTARPVPENRWFDGGDSRFRPGNLFVMARNLWTAYLVDRETGGVIWNYEGDHENGTNLEQGLIRGHEIHMIEKGLPGAGNLLMFDNGLADVRPYSIIREVDPTTKETVWRYEDREVFFSNAAGSVQRLPGGTTLISDDRNRRIFEVNEQKEIIWEVRLAQEVSRSNRYNQNFCPHFKRLSSS